MSALRIWGTELFEDQQTRMLCGVGVEWDREISGPIDAPLHIAAGSTKRHEPREGGVFGCTSWNMREGTFE